MRIDSSIKFVGSDSPRTVYTPQPRATPVRGFVRSKIANPFAPDSLLSRVLGRYHLSKQLEIIDARAPRIWELARLADDVEKRMIFTAIPEAWRRNTTVQIILNVYDPRFHSGPQPQYARAAEFDTYSPMQKSSVKIYEKFVRRLQYRLAPADHIAQASSLTRSLTGEEHFAKADTITELHTILDTIARDYDPIAPPEHQQLKAWLNYYNHEVLARKLVHALKNYAPDDARYRFLPEALIRYIAMHENDGTYFCHSLTNISKRLSDPRLFRTVDDRRD